MKASCLKCHGDPDTAPSGVTKLYGKVNGFGFKEGDVSGIISVKVPYDFNILKFNFFKNFTTVIALLCFAFSLLIPMFYVTFFILKPLKKKTNEIDMLSSGKLTKEILTINSPKSSNEIDQLHNSIARLGKNMYSFFKKNKDASEEAKKTIKDNE